MKGQRKEVAKSMFNFYFIKIFVGTCSKCFGKNFSYEKYLRQITKGKSHQARFTWYGKQQAQFTVGGVRLFSGILFFSYNFNIGILEKKNLTAMIYYLI